MKTKSKLPQKRIEFQIQKQPPKIKSKLLKLLKKHNAVLQFNQQQNLYEIDVQVKFQNLKQRDQFLKFYVDKQKEKLKDKNNRKTLQQINVGSNNYKNENGGLKSDIIIEQESQQGNIVNHSYQDSAKQQQKQNMIDSSRQYSEYSKQREYDSQKNRNNNALNQQYQYRTTQAKKYSNTNQQQDDQIQPEQILQIHTFQSQLDYQKLNNKLTQAVTLAFDKISTKKSTNDIIIIQQQHQQSQLENSHNHQYNYATPTNIKYKQNFIKSNNQFQQKPKILSPKTKKQHQRIINQLNKQIKAQQSQFKRDFNKYFVQSVIQQQQIQSSQFSSNEYPSQTQNQKNKKKKDLNKLYQYKIPKISTINTKMHNFSNRPFSKKTKTDNNTTSQTPRKNKVNKNQGGQIGRNDINFDDKKFKQFILLNKRKLDDLFEDLKKNLKQSNKYNSLNNYGNKTKPQHSNNNNSEIQSMEYFSDKWRSELQIQKLCLNSFEDKSHEFETKFYKQYQNQILMTQSNNMNSAQLIKYFRFLIRHAKHLYLQYLKNTNANLKNSRKS